MGRLDGKSAVVLGAASRGNIAQYIARRFRAEGAQVLVAGRKMDDLRRFAAEIGAHAAACDITQPADHDALAKTALIDSYRRSAI
jgi:NADP-dependent 3-hydroxy acid dehydrogenase YdfG